MSIQFLLTRLGLALSVALAVVQSDGQLTDGALSVPVPQSPVLGPLRMPRESGARSPQSGQSSPDEIFLSGEVLVRWIDQPSDETLAAMAVAAAEPAVGGRATRLRVPPGRELAIVATLRARADVVWAQPNFIWEVAVTPNDPRFVDQWGLRRIEAPAAWETTTGSSTVVVAVVDTGVDLRHPDLQGHLVEGHNFVREERPPQDDNGHGTHVAGTIAATLNNNVGIVGVAPGVAIMPVKALGRTGRGADDTVAAGLYWAADHGAWVINMSLGPAFSGTQATPLVEEAIAYAIGLGAVVVTAAGNRGTSEPTTLSANPGVISVAATMPNDARAPFSNHGPWVHVGAPGTGVLSTFFDGSSTYRAESGTSVAAPYVSGVAALLLSLRPELGPGDVARILQSTADPLPGQDVGAGRLNAARAVAAARDLPPPRPAAPSPGAPGREAATVPDASSPPEASSLEGSAGNARAP